MQSKVLLAHQVWGNGELVPHQQEDSGYLRLNFKLHIYFAVQVPPALPPSVRRSVKWLLGWLVVCMNRWLVGWLVSHLVRWSVSLSVSLLVGWFTRKKQKMKQLSLTGILLYKIGL